MKKLNMNARIEPSANPPCIAALQNRSHNFILLEFNLGICLSNEIDCIKTKRREVASEPRNSINAIGHWLHHFLANLATMKFYSFCS